MHTCSYQLCASILCSFTLFRVPDADNYRDACQHMSHVLHERHVNPYLHEMIENGMDSLSKYKSGLVHVATCRTQDFRV